MGRQIERGFVVIRNSLKRCVRGARMLARMPARMPARLPGPCRSSPGRLAANCLLALAVVPCGLGLDARRHPAAAEALAADKPPLSIAVLLSSRNDVCHDPGNVAAIRKLATLEQDRINRQGGIAGHRLDIRFLDDRRDKDKAVANIRTALGSGSTLAIIGLSNSQIAKHVFETIGGEIKASGVPFLSDISVNSIFETHDNVYTTRPSQDDERLPVMVEFLKRSGVERPAFMGLRDQVFSTVLGDGLKAAIPDRPLVVDRRLGLVDDKLEEREIDTAVGEMKQVNPDLLVLSVGSSRAGEVIKAMVAAGVTPKLFLSGRIDAIPAEITATYPADIFQLGWDKLPEVYNDRMLKRVLADPPETWLFEGAKIAEAPGWAKGECKERPADATAQPLATDNLRAIGTGMQFADMVGLVSAAAATADANAGLPARRARVLEQLRTTFVNGRGVYQGSFENWSFRPESRAAARNPFVIMLSRGARSMQLAPTQFVRLKHDVLRPIQTLYLDIDMIRAFRVDDNAKSFFAEFYLSMRDGTKGASLDQIEFANAFLDPATNDRRVTVRTLSDGKANGAFPDGIAIYQVSGQFMFEPDLENYPFDTQRFAIEIRPKQGDAPFIIQPPPEALRDRAVVTDGWDPKAQFVGYDEDFVTTLDARTLERSVVPFYRASFAWQMNRQTTDYYLRVVVPLGFILMIAYLSIFIPLSHFEAIVTIQVTALLSAVALYLSLPDLDADTTTLSDRIFLFNYMAVSLMIGLSILRMNGAVAEHPRLKTLLGWLHVTLVPLMVVAMGLYVVQVTSTAV